MYYNFARVHQTLRVTPAMEAGIADHVWSIEESSAYSVEGHNVKRVRRFGMYWSQPTKTELREMAPRMFVFMLAAPFLLWGLIRLFNWLFSN